MHCIIYAYQDMRTFIYHYTRAMQTTKLQLGSLPGEGRGSLNFCNGRYKNNYEVRYCIHFKYSVSYNINTASIAV